MAEFLIHVDLCSFDTIIHVDLYSIDTVIHAYVSNYHSIDTGAHGARH